nr:ferritin-like domain-containing protein [Tomitella biformata]
MSENDIAALGVALEAEHAAVYSYGLITAYGNASRRDQVAVHAAAHRARRDATAAMLAAGGAVVPAAAAGYTVPFPVTDPASAAQLAVTVEEDAATAWRSALEHADSEPVRGIAIDNLTDSAVRAGNWRIALGVTPPTTPFPGQPV